MFPKKMPGNLKSVKLQISNQVASDNKSTNLWDAQNLFLIDELCSRHNHIPPYHCQYNPNEHVWAIVKKYERNIEQSWSIVGWCSDSERSCGGKLFQQLRPKLEKLFAF